MALAALLAAVAFSVSLPGRLEAQQGPDTTYDTRVSRPAYTVAGPRVLFDEAHHNVHKTTDRYGPFAELIRHDGYEVVPNRKPFTRKSLAKFQVLVIVNALGSEWMNDSTASRPAFSDHEGAAVAEWVRGGSSLLLIADHLPMGAAAQGLASRFGVTMGNCLTVDTTAANHVGENAGVLLFSRDNGLLRDHPITLGRDSTERIHNVFAFGGQSLGGAPGSSSFLVLSDAALDLVATSLQDILTTKVRRSAAGRSQGIAFDSGKGRVVVLGEAAMFSAQWSGPQHALMGMNVPGSDDRQLALNVMHWLSRSLN